MLHESKQGRFFEKHSEIGDLAWKNFAKLICNMNFFTEFRFNLQSFYKISTQDIGKTYLKLLQHSFYTLLQLSKVVKTIGDLSTTSQK